MTVKDRALARAFPQDWDRLQKSRATSNDLEEICHDFELLTQELLALQHRNTCDAEKLLDQLHESLAGLHEEIRAYLDRTRHDLPHHNHPTQSQTGDSDA